MNCPVCKDSLLTMSERKGIEIDYCPKCRGVWLDRGELDRLIELQSTTEAIPPLPRAPDHFRDPRPVSDPNGYYKHKRKKSLFEELFD